MDVRGNSTFLEFQKQSSEKIVDCFARVTPNLTMREVKHGNRADTGKHAKATRALVTTKAEPV